MVPKNVKAAKVQTKGQGVKPLEEVGRKPDQDASYIRDQLNKGDVAESHAADYYRKGLDHYRDAGKRLAKVREACREKGHPYYAKWLGWLKDNGIDQQRDSECRRLHEGWEKLPLGGSFSLKQALGIIGGKTGDGQDTGTETGSGSGGNRGTEGDGSRVVTFSKQDADKLDPMVAELIEARYATSEAGAISRAIKEACERQRAGKEVSRG
jgi:hypothetical protein